MAINDLNQGKAPSPLSATVHHMALSVYEQSHLLLMDIKIGTQLDSLEGRLGCISGAVVQLENLIGSYRTLNSEERIHEPNKISSLCTNCHVLNQID
ncbi:MAG: hypothetical protein ACKVQS_01530 [Fimbriimonadaceae bacterium]